ncbi:MAG: NnrU family protein [Pseudomonadota bacterium]
MGWAILLIGLFLFVAGHVFKRLRPADHAALGEKAKLYATAVLLVALVAMIFGYQWAGFVPVWSPPSFLVHLNNLLMLLAVYLLFAGKRGVWLASKIRHPMLTAVKTWAVAHLLVNGDLASILLFGGLLAWAVFEVIIINKAEPEWTPPEAKGAKTEVVYAGAVLIIYIVIGLIHGWLGYWPFG